MINNLQEFYNHITNPLDDDYTIQKMIDAYQQEQYLEEKNDEQLWIYEYFLQRRNNRSGFAERDINLEIPASIFSIENIYTDQNMIPYAKYLNYSLRQPFFGVLLILFLMIKILQRCITLIIIIIIG